MLRLQHISKYFHGIRALEDISLHISAGQVHAICGENGAGKSTLMNIISGNLQPDGGKLFWRNNAAEITDVQAARLLGIGIVYQERSLADNLDVAENIFTDKKPTNRFGFINFPALHTNAQQLLDHLNIKDFTSKTLVGKLSPGQKQMVEIAKALSLRPQLLILDEPTASISESDTETLFRLIKSLKEQNVGIIYISHRMREIMTIADMITILKDGKLQGTFEAKSLTIQDMIKKMVGRTLATQMFENNSSSEILLEVVGLSGAKFSNINFKLHKGEILGLAGLVGAGRTEIAKVIMGADKKTSGAIIKHGKKININDPTDAINNGIAYLPEERKSLGSFQSMNIEENIISAALNKVSFKGWLNKRKVKEASTNYIEQLSIKSSSTTQTLSNLSGGNQQKVVLAKCLFTDPEILIADEPTHGVDVGSKMEIYSILKKLSSQGTGIILISSELPELLLLSDRILVVHEGNQMTIISKSEATEESIMNYASGQKDKFTIS